MMNIWYDKLINNRIIWCQPVLKMKIENTHTHTHKGQNNYAKNRLGKTSHRKKNEGWRKFKRNCWMSGRERERLS